MAWHLHQPSPPVRSRFGYGLVPELVLSHPGRAKIVEQQQLLHFGAGKPHAVLADVLVRQHWQKSVALVLSGNHSGDLEVDLGSPVAHNDQPLSFEWSGNMTQGLRGSADASDVVGMAASLDGSVHNSPADLVVYGALEFPFLEQSRGQVLLLTLKGCWYQRV
jgi:hypothetical protein